MNRINFFKQLWLVPTLCLLALACNENKKGNESNDNTLRIRGKVSNPDSGFVVLTMATDSGIKRIDSTKLNADNTFEIKNLTKEKAFYYLEFFKKQTVFLIGGPSDTLFVQVDGNSQTGNYTVKGTKDNDDLKMASELISSFQAEFSQLQNEYMISLQKGEKEAAEVQMKKLDVFYVAKLNEAKNLIRKMGSGLPSMSLAANFISIERDLPFMDSLAQEFQKSMPNSRYTKDFVNFVNKNKVVTIGSIAPDFTASTPEGKWVKLSDFKGKYILLDFWASWCGPCRQENPNVVKLYQRYKNKGFTILSFSLDNIKEDWIQAIKEDHLDWNHVSELKKWDSPIAKLYQIESIPATFLLDKEGKIVGKNLRGKELEEKLASLLK